MDSSHFAPVIVLIPAKNEERTVGEVIQQVKTYFPGTILVIDDASTDRTKEVAQTAGAQVLPLPFSLGAWGAIQTGLRYALKHGYRTAVTMDADGQHEAASLPLLVAPLIFGDCDVVIGACPERGSLARQLAWAFFRRLSGIPLEDLTSGLRAYRLPAIELLASKTATLLDYQDLGVLMLLKRANLRLQEIAIPMQPRTNGHSRIFNSWWAVSKYLLHTGILCLAQAEHGKKCRIN